LHKGWDVLIFIYNQFYNVHHPVILKQ
jgi:hypothetical protein